MPSAPPASATASGRPRSAKVCAARGTPSGLWASPAPRTAISRYALGPRSGARCHAETSATSKAACPRAGRRRLHDARHARRLAAHPPRFRDRRRRGRARRECALAQRVRMPPDASSKPLLARTPGKDPGGRLFPASGLSLPAFAHNWSLTHPTHTHKRLLLRGPGASTVRANSCPSGQTDVEICDPDMASHHANHREGPAVRAPAGLQRINGCSRRSGLFGNIRADTISARIWQTAGNPNGTPRFATDGRTTRENAQRVAKVPMTNGTVREQRRRRPRGRSRARLG